MSDVGVDEDINIDTAKQDEHRIRGAVIEFTRKTGLGDFGLNDEGKLNLLIEDVHTILELTKNPDGFLLVMVVLGQLDQNTKESLPWLMQNGFDTWVYGNINYGFDAEHRQVLAYSLLPGDTLTEDTLYDFLPFIITATKEAREHISASTFPKLTMEPANAL